MIHSNSLRHIYEMHLRGYCILKPDVMKAIKKYYDDIDLKKTEAFLNKVFKVKGIK